METNVYKNQINNKFNNRLLKSIICRLGVSPPGSLTITNQCINCQYKNSNNSYKNDITVRLLQTCEFRIKINIKTLLIYTEIACH